MNNIARFITIGILFTLLILLRAFASDLFYDPFIDYFKNDYLHREIPNFNIVKLFGSLFLRYLLNAVISLGIIYLFFNDKKILRFSIWFYGIAFLILSTLFLLLLKMNLITTHLPIFYTRRFLIHPIFVLVLLPAFYYQKNNVEK